MRPQITIYLSDKERMLIIDASKKLSLNLSSFCRTSTIQMANKILEAKDGE